MLLIKMEISIDLITIFELKIKDRIASQSVLMGWLIFMAVVCG